MHNSIEKLKHIEEIVKSKEKDLNLKKRPCIIAVSKTFKIDKILPLIEVGHEDFGENKVQEALDKWSDIKLQKPNVRLHLLGGLQTNKVKYAVKIFDFIHSVDSKKLAKKIADEQTKHKKNIKIFIQVNLGNEIQKSGVKKNELDNFFSYCKEVGLNVIGLMCIPPVTLDPTPFFKELKSLNDSLNLSDLSMGMSSDYKEAIENFSTYLRIGSEIFGKRD
jgi:pyridoxal phosphate enzyme (YggS family)